MSTSDQPESAPLTRRQLRELRNTAATPVITTGGIPIETDAEPAAPVVVQPASEAEPVVLSAAPPAPQNVDLSAPVLTRRAARQRERLRTASVPVVSAEAVAEVEADSEPTAPADETVDPGADVAPPETADAATAPVTDAAPVDDVAPVEEERPVVAADFGSSLLAGDGVELELSPSFDGLLARGAATTGSIAAPNALILSQTPDTGAFVSPVAATGEVLVTGTYALPESLGSTGTLPGSADGKDVDAALLDGELPSASSPAPIAASAAISTIKSAEDIIKPPAPEKGSRLMLVLGITAGTLALALVGVLIIALTTGALR
ncbi:MAG: hypothetical protein QM622_04625 [Microbacterium sp.]